MIVRLLCMLCWMLLSFNTLANSPVVVVDRAYTYSETAQTFSSIQSLKQDAWVEVARFTNHGFKNGEFWLRVVLENQSQDTQSVIYRFAYALHDEVDFYQVSLSGELKKTWLQGDMRDQSDHNVMDKHAAINITIPANSRQLLYIRVASKNALVLTADLFSKFEHEKNVHFEAIFSSMIYGVLLVMALYNLGLAISLMDKAYFSYVLYVLTFTTFVLTLSGDGYYYFWNNSPHFNQYLLPVISGLLIIPSLLFPYYLLNIKRNAPFIAKMYKGFMVVAMLFVFSIPIIGVANAVVLVNSLSSILSLIILSVGFYLTYKGVPLAGWYTFAWLILLLGLSVLSVSSLGFMDSNLLTRNAGLLGGVIEAIILSLVLAQRISQEKREKMLAVQESAQNKKLFQEIFNQAPVGIMRFNSSGELVTINPALVKMLGYDSVHQAMENYHVLDQLLTDYRDINRELIENGKVLDKQMSITTVNENILHCSVSLHLHQGANEQYVEAYLTDITERVENTNVKEFMEQERHTSMEHLVTGVAHEINTPLGVNITSVSHIKELLSEVSDDLKNNTLTKKKFAHFVDDAHQLLQIVTHNLNKMSNLVRRFKMVSMGKTDKISLNFKQQLEQSVFNHHLIEEDIQLEVKCDGQVYIETYPAAWDIIIEQLVENSVVHGFSDQQEDKTISIEVTSIGEHHWRFQYRDNGSGVDAAVLQKAFNPFITTKRSSSEHAGLGLYRIYNLVQRVLKGEVTLEQDKGFHLVLEFSAPQGTNAS